MDGLKKRVCKDSTWAPFSVRVLTRGSIKRLRGLGMVQGFRD